MNGLKLRKEDQHCIDQGDVISILQKDFKMFYFVSETRLKEKYLIGKDSGHGPSGVVKMAFERKEL